MSRDDVTQAEENAFVRIFERLNRQVERVMGPPPVTAAGDPEPPVSLRSCPLCGHLMGEHRFDHSTLNVMVHCPVPDAERKPSPAHHEPLGELGMPASAERLKKLSKRNG